MFLILPGMVVKAMPMRLDPFWSVLKLQEFRGNGSRCPKIPIFRGKCAFNLPYKMVSDFTVESFGNPEKVPWFHFGWSPFAGELSKKIMSDCNTYR